MLLDQRGLPEPVASLALVALAGLQGLPGPLALQGLWGPPGPPVQADLREAREHRAQWDRREIPGARDRWVQLVHPVCRDHKVPPERQGVWVRPEHQELRGQPVLLDRQDKRDLWVELERLEARVRCWTGLDWLLCCRLMLSTTAAICFFYPLYSVF